MFASHQRQVLNPLKEVLVYSKRIGVILAALCLIVLAGTAVAVDDVTSTKHNLSATPPDSATVVDYGEVCVYCHTPHGGEVSAPLWNRSFSAATYQMYNNTHSSTIDMTVDAQPTGVSLACLSCHDGTIGLDVITNPPNAFGGSVPGTTPGTNTMPASSFAFLDTELRNDHPISVTYDVGDDPAFNSKSAVASGGLKLYGDGTTDKVQCASCHNPHDKTNVPFLRKSNSNSNLCKTCHIK